MSNKTEGNEFERELCWMLSERGFWSHNLVPNASGQPADIMAIRNGHAYLIDAKNMASKRFRVSRIESNQSTAMSYWETCGNGEGWFAIRQHDEIYFITLSQLYALCDYDLSVSVSWDDIKREGMPFDDWIMTHGLRI